MLDFFPIVSIIVIVCRTFVLTSGLLCFRMPRTPVVKQKGSRRPSSSRSQGSSNRRTNRIEDDLLMRIGLKGRGKGDITSAVLLLICKRLRYPWIIMSERYRKSEGLCSLHNCFSYQLSMCINT